MRGFAQVRLATLLLLNCLIHTPASSAQTSSSSAGSGNPSGLNPIRSSESHKEADGRTLDKQSLERLGPDGRYVPYLDVEKESVRVNATTVRTIERTYGRDPDGRRKLTQVVEEEKQASGGNEKVVRNTSNPDADGRLQLVSRDVAETRQTSAKVQDTKTTTYTLGSDGRMTPSLQSEERLTRIGEHDTQFRRSTRLPDLNGGWQLQEVREGAIHDDGKERTNDEQVSRPDNDGRMAVVGRTVSKEPVAADGKRTVDTYSTNSPGSADEGRLQLTQRVTTTTRKTLQGGTVTEQQLSRRDTGNSNDGLRLTEKTIDIVRPTSIGTQSQRQTISIDSNGSSNVVWVDTKQSTEPAPVNTKPAANSQTQPPSNQPH